MASRFLERGGWWVLAQSALMVLVAAAGPLSPGLWRHGLARWIAWGLFAIGAVLGIGGVWVLGRNRTIFPRPNAGSSLVTGGLYAWVRHPLYSSLMSLSFGWGLYWGSWPTLLAGSVLTGFLNLKAAQEERWLRRHFPDYAGYARGVRRFIPYLW